MAEAFFNKLSKCHEAISAGTNSIFSGMRIEEISEKVCKCMLEKGIDISKKLSKQITKELVSSSDIVVWIAPEEKIPDYLEKGKIILWNIEDAGGKAYEVVCQVRDDVRRLVEDLIQKIENS